MNILAFKRVRYTWLALLMLMAPQIHAAVIDQIVATSSTNQISLGRTNTFAMNWQVFSSTGANDPAFTITLDSQQGEFRTINNTLLGVVNTHLGPRILSVAKGGASASTTFTETVTMPAYVADSARKLGVNQIYYVRSFTGAESATSTTVTNAANLAFNISSSSSGMLDITRVALSFDTDDTQRVTGINARLQAQAKLDTQGTGILSASWEVAEPPSTMGKPAWHSVQHVQQQLTGTQQVVISSPELPTLANGVYLVRLRILKPVLSFTEPQIEYTVAEGLDALNRKINVIGPQGLTTVGPQTRFAWEKISGSQAYRLEFYTQEIRVKVNTEDHKSTMRNETSAIVPGKRVAGIMVKPEHSSTILPAVSLGHLEKDKHYFWQVQAIDAQGRVFATSPLGEIIGQ